MPKIYEEKYRTDLYEQREEIKNNLDRKDYLLTVYQKGDTTMTMGDHSRQVLPRRFYVACSLSEIPDYIKWMQQPFWTHPDIENPEVANEDIPFEEKKRVIYRDVIVEPMSEELEKSYLDASEKGFFKIQRTILEDN